MLAFMNSDNPLQNGSLDGGGSQLWRSSVGWKLVVLGVVLCAGFYLWNPTVQWTKSAAVSAPSQHSVPATPQSVAHPTPVAQKLPAGMSSQIALADENCGAGGPMKSPLNPPPPMPGEIVGFMPQAVATALIARSEQGANGKIDPAYVHNLRAIFHPKNAPAFMREAVIVPSDMTVSVGEDVRMVGGHASPNLACHYVPNVIVSAVPKAG
jgi:hypothetical protein